MNAVSSNPEAVPLDLSAALECTLTYNPSLITLRQNRAVSAAALAVARQFPTSLNPTVSIDVVPWVFERSPGGPVQQLETRVAVTWAQPVELGHRTKHRLGVARAAFRQTQWTILQAELQAMIETYRLHQTATYRRQQLEVAERLMELNRQLAEVLRRQMEASQAAAADVVLAEVESAAASAKADLARQEYLIALTELRRQIGLPEYAATAVPVGTLTLPRPVLPDGDDALVQLALAARPEIHAAEAQVSGAWASVRLARADRIPIPSIGPLYEHDESGVTFYGLAVSTPVPVLNTGRTLVAQREAEYRRDRVALEQMRRQVAVEVRAALARWRQTVELAARAQQRTAPLRGQAERMQRLFEAGQTDVVRLLQVRQRTIDAQNAQLDALWQATQSYADLLAAAGAGPLLGSLPAPGERRQ
jgi:cobalt-zinc-cadmium efflux system outer membrane protein